MFAWLFGKKNLSFNCPMCEGDMSTELNPDDTEGSFEFNPDYDVISGGTCPFCKLNVDITIHRESRTIKAFDPKWEKVRHTFEQKETALEDQLDIASELLEEIDDVLDDGDATDVEINKARKKRTPADKKVTTLENKIETLQESFYAKEDKYEERQWKWQEKFDAKYG